MSGVAVVGAGVELRRAVGDGCLVSQDQMAVRSARAVVSPHSAFKRCVGQWSGTKFRGASGS